VHKQPAAHGCEQRVQEAQLCKVAVWDAAVLVALLAPCELAGRAAAGGAGSLRYKQLQLCSTLIKLMEAEPCLSIFAMPVQVCHVQPPNCEKATGALGVQHTDDQHLCCCCC
jgi:hypothetical protein